VGEPDSTWLAVELGKGCTEAGRRLDRVPEHPAGSQHLRRLGRSRHWIHPVPGLPGDDRVHLPMPMRLVRR